MARIAGVDLPRDKRVEAALPYIYGIGLHTSQKLLERTRINPDTRVRDLTDDEVNRIREIVDKEMRVEGDLRREVVDEHQAVDGHRLLSRVAPSARHADARAADADERAHAARSAAGRRRPQEEVDASRAGRRSPRGEERARFKRRSRSGMAEKRRQGKGKTRVRRRDRKNIPRGRAYVQATFNNTIVTMTDPAGNVIAWSSAGSNGFKGSRKSTPYAAQVTAESAARKAMEHGLRQVDVFVKGPGSGREMAIRSLQTAGVQVVSITDTTPIPFNGCRPPKRRRV